MGNDEILHDYNLQNRFDEKWLITREDEYDSHVVARVFAKLIYSLRATGVQQILAHLRQNKIYISTYTFEYYSFSS